MKIKPDYTRGRGEALYAPQLQNEYWQSVAEGKDVEKYEKLFKAVEELPMDENKVKMADVLFDLVLHAPMREGYAYVEPSNLEGIKAQRPGAGKVCGADVCCDGTGGENSAADETKAGTTIQKDVLREKIHGAWMGRICGCLLGKTVEGIKTDELIPLLEQSGNYPMHRYIRSTDVTPEMKENYRYFKQRWLIFYADQVSYMPFDDDTNYVVLAQTLIEKYGRNFTPYDVSQEWQRLQPMTSYYTAEAVAYRNFSLAIQPPDSAVYQNPFREWIGAQIRGDYFGYINPGKPEEAAELAWRDASISHVKNGIYGEMYVAAMLATAAVTDDIHEIIRGGMAQIPEKSRLYEHLETVLGWYDSGVSEKECFDRIHEEWDEYTLYGWCHTISNAMVVTASLLYGGGDYGKSICLAVQTGYDTDCNGATVGSVIGMRGGISCIPEEWTQPIHGTLESTIFGMGKSAVTDLVDLTMKHVENGSFLS
ncbi:MAG: ADP-ribosylglycohydrolase family protein [Firmicutes bacterium]|nr:ADP-ribosylglycohydrolase family protein [Bacillota bacterium]